MPRRLLLLPLLLLPACGWSGNAFYTAPEAQAAIAPGNYTSNESANPAPNGTIHISVLPNGMTRFDLIDSGRRDSQVGFVPLGTDGHFYIWWLARFDGEDLPADGMIYGLLERRPDGHYMVYMPDCGHDRADALAAGAAPKAESGGPACVFPSRASLESGMRAYARHPFDGMELIPTR
jgi:hypothetical protein